MVLFFLGSGGRIFPGSSVRSALCSRLKSPYLLPTKYSSSPFRLTLRINSYGRVVSRYDTKLALCPARNLTYGVLVVSDVAFDGRYPDAGDINIPAVDIVPLGQGRYDPGVDGVAVHDLEFRKPYAFFKSRGCPDAGHHHQLDQLLGLDGQLPPLGFLQPVFGG